MYKMPRRVKAQWDPTLTDLTTKMCFISPRSFGSEEGEMGSKKELFVCCCLNHIPPLPKLTLCGVGSVAACKGQGDSCPSFWRTPRHCQHHPVDVAPRREWGQHAWGQGPGYREQGKELGLRRAEGETLGKGGVRKALLRGQ